MKDNAPRDLFPPDQERIKQRAEKENLLRQRSRVIWLSGLSGAGKTTIGSALEDALFKKGYLTQILDGDIVRSGINNNLHFTLEDRLENIRRIAEVSKLFLNCGIIIINCFITPTNEMRKMVRDIIGKENLVEVYVNAPLAVCEERDTKGLYGKARRGEIKNFTGINSPFDEPDQADIEIRTDLMNIEASAEKLLDFILPMISYEG
jgi:adenylylsulfate kinase